MIGLVWYNGYLGALSVPSSCPSPSPSEPWVSCVPVAELAPSPCTVSAVYGDIYNALIQYKGGGGGGVKSDMKSELVRREMKARSFVK